MPGYLRAFSAEVAPSAAEASDAAAAEAEAAAAAEAGHADPLSAAAHAAQGPLHQLVATLQAAAGAGAQLGGNAAAPAADGVLPAFEGIHQFHQLQQEVEAQGIAPAPAPTLPPTLAAMSYHQRLMDNTPAGRLMQRRWQEQIILETRTVEASAMRYRLEVQSAVSRKEAASMPPARRLLMHWFKPLTLAIQEEQRKVRRGRGWWEKPG